MNILCIEQFSQLGGGQRSLLDLLPAFIARGWRPCVAVPEHGPLSKAVYQWGFPIETLNTGKYSSMRKPLFEMWRYGVDFPRLARRLRAIVQQQNIDLLYANGARFLPIAAWVARRTAIPLVFHCHSRLLQGSAVMTAGNSLRLANARVVACSAHAVEPLRHYVSTERLSIIYNGVGPLPNPSGPSSEGVSRIGVIGRIEQEKGQLEFVEAAKLVLNDVTMCRFSVTGAPLFSGETYYNKVMEASRELPIWFCGWQDDIAKVFANLDLLVVPSSNDEATTRVILEAYAAGVPVVAFPSGGIPEILKDEETGFLARNATAASLAERILSVLRMPREQLRSVVNRASQAWKERFTLERYQENVCEVLLRAREERC